MKCVGNGVAIDGGVRSVRWRDQPHQYQFISLLLKRRNQRHASGFAA